MVTEQPIEDEAPVQQVTNASIEENVQLQILRILQAMQAIQNTGDSNERGDNDRGRHRNINKKTPDNAAFQRIDKTEYCWAHGACNHKTGACNRKAPGHISNATFTNRLGGSNAFCQAVVGANDE